MFLSAVPVILADKAGNERAIPQRRQNRGLGVMAFVVTLSVACMWTWGMVTNSTGADANLDFLLLPSPPGAALRGSVGTLQPSTLASPSAPSAFSVNGVQPLGMLALFVSAAAITAVRGRRQRIQLQAEGKTPLSDLNVGDTFDGVVSRVASIGVWLDIGAAKEALLPAKEVGQKTFKVGDRVKGVKIQLVTDGATPMERKIRVTLKKLASDIAVGDSIEGTVLRSGTFGVFFDIGLSQDALGPKSVLDKDVGEFKEGDKVQLSVIEIQGDKVTVANKEGAKAREKGTPVSSLKVGDTVSGTVVRVNASLGIFINIGADSDALCRSNQLAKPITAYQEGEKIDGLKISSINKEKGQLEVSCRRLNSEVQEGEKLEGTVARLTEYGIFFDAGLARDVLGPTRLLSKEISEYKVGSVADLLVVKVEGDRVTVTTKGEDEMGTPLSQLMRGAVVTGKVEGVATNIGLFLDIGAAASALLRVKMLTKPIDEYKEGDEIPDLMISKVDVNQGQVEVVPEGYEAGAALADFPVGLEVEGKVVRVTNFGVFVDIGAERDALYSVSQLSMPQQNYKPGDIISGLKVTECDVEKGRLAVSDKKGAGDFTVGEEVSGKVTKILAFGVFVDIGAAVEALVPASQLAQAVEEYEVGQELTDLKIANLDPTSNKISASQREGAGMEAKIDITSLQMGQQVKGVVRMVKDYGVFVDIGLGRRDALIPASLLGTTTTDSYTANQQIDVYIAAVEVDSNRVTCSIEAPPEGGFQVGRAQAQSRVSVQQGELPRGQCYPDQEYWLHQFMHHHTKMSFQRSAEKYGTFLTDEEREERYVEEEGVPWKEWAEKYPGMIKFPDREYSIPVGLNCTHVKGAHLIMPSIPHYFPVPVHLRKPDAGPPQIPKFDFEHLEGQGMFAKQIKPEIYMKYRTPPFNDPDYRQYPTPSLG